MPSTILLKRSNTAGNDAYTGSLGEVTLDTQTRKLRIHDSVTLGGHVVANMADVQSVIDRIDGLTTADIAGLDAALASINADINDHETRLSNVETTYIKKDGTVAFTGDINAGTHKVTNVLAPTTNYDAANKEYVDTEIASLGNVFSYGGSFTAGTQATPFDLSTLSDTTAGSYYTADTSGYVIYETVTSYVNTNDAVLFNAAGSYKIIDNSNSEISGTLDFVSVSGSTDTGYTIDLHTTFKNRITSIETDVDLKAYKANPAFTGDGTFSGTAEVISGTTVALGDPLVNVFSVVDSASTSMLEVKEDGSVRLGSALTVDGTGTTITGDTSIDGVITVTGGATVNADFVGDSLNLTGNLNVSGNTTLGDTAADSISILGTATAITQPVTDTSTKVATTEYTKNFIETGTYTVDGGTF